MKRCCGESCSCTIFALCAVESWQSICHCVHTQQDQVVSALSYLCLGFCSFCKACPGSAVLLQVWLLQEPEGVAWRGLSIFFGRAPCNTLVGDSWTLGCKRALWIGHWGHQGVTSDANPAKPFAVCQCVSGMLQRPCVWMPVSLTCLLATAVCHPDPLSEVGWSALGPGKLSLAHLGFLQGFDKEHFPLSAKGPSFSIIMPMSAFGQDNENMISNLKKIDGVILNKWLLNVLHNLQLNTFSFSSGCVCVCWCWCYFMWCDERKIDFLESIVYVI